MNFYEVKVSLHADKLLLVRADDEDEAEEIALDALESGEIDMTDIEVEDYVSDVIPATEDFYELPLDSMNSVIFINVGYYIRWINPFADRFTINDSFLKVRFLPIPGLICTTN